MKLYIANGVYVGTQAEAKKLDKLFTQVEVPTDKEGLIAYLNEHQVDRDVHHQQVADGPYAVDDDASDLLGDDDASDLLGDTPVVHHVEHNTAALHDRQMTQIEVEEAIQRATPVELSSYASNVCWRIKELANVA